MKSNKLHFALMAAVAASLSLISCKKESVTPDPMLEPAISASSLTGAVGQSIALSLTNLPAGTSVDWESSANAAITTTGNSGEKAAAVFNAPGTYTVSAYLMKTEHINGGAQHGHSADSTAHHQGAESTHHHHADNSHHHHHDGGTVHGNEHEGNLIEKNISITIR